MVSAGVVSRSTDLLFNSPLIYILSAEVAKAEQPQRLHHIFLPSVMATSLSLVLATINYIRFIFNCIENLPLFDSYR